MGIEIVGTGGNPELDPPIGLSPLGIGPGKLGSVGVSVMGQIVVETGIVVVTVVTVELPGQDGTAEGHRVMVAVVVVYTVEMV